MTIQNKIFIFCMAIGVAYLPPAYSQTSKPQSPEKKQSQDPALLKMRQKIDKIEGITWYIDKSTPQTNNRNNIHLYIGQKGNHVFLRLKFQYASESWLFIRSFILKVDNQKFERSLKFERDHHSTIWEWADINANKAEVEMARAIINSKEAIIRYEGTKYYDDRKITQQEKIALKNVLDAFTALGGKMPER